MGGSFCCLELVFLLTRDLSGTELAILNRELSDSESCDSNRAIPRSLYLVKHR